MEEHHHGTRIAISDKPNNVSDAYRSSHHKLHRRRDAEKVDSTPESPLSAAGRERALALVEALAPLGVTAIYCPALRRNRETVQPLSEHLGLAILTIPGWQLLNTRQFAQDFIQKALANHGGGVIL